MAVCYFNKDYKRFYDCKYEKKKDGIEVMIEYAIDDEIKLDKNGVTIIGSNTQYKKRDILIIDSNSKMNYFLKEASYSSCEELYGQPDGKNTTKFFITLFG